MRNKTLGKEIGERKIQTSARDLEVRSEGEGSDFVEGRRGMIGTGVDEIPRKEGRGGGSLDVGPPWGGRKRREPPRRNPQHLLRFGCDRFPIDDLIWVRSEWYWFSSPTTGNAVERESAREEEREESGGKKGK